MLLNEFLGNFLKQRIAVYMKKVVIQVLQGSVG